MGVLFRAVSFRAFHRLPAVAVRTPTDQKADNRSIACLLSNFTMCICRSKPCPAHSLLSHPRSITYAHRPPGESPAPLPKLGLFTTPARLLTDSEGSSYRNLRFPQWSAASSKFLSRANAQQRGGQLRPPLYVRYVRMPPRSSFCCEGGHTKRRIFRVEPFHDGSVLNEPHHDLFDLGIVLPMVGLRMFLRFP